MAAVVTDQYKQYLMGSLTGVTQTPALTCHLFTNSGTTFGDTTTSGLTELSGGGYSDVSVPYTNWTLSTTSHVATAVSGTLTWNFTGSVGFYGYYLTDDNNSNKYVAGETFSSGEVTFGSGGGTFTLTITLNCGDS